MFHETSTDSGRFGSTKTFTYLSGRRSQVVVVGDHPDARCASFLYKTSIKNSWPSQWHSKYSKGYIRFTNGKIFDLEKEAIDCRPAYIFPWSKDIEFLYRRQTSEQTILEAFDELCSEDKKALAKLIVETAGLGDKPWFCSMAGDFWVSNQKQVQPYLQTLSLRQLEDLAALLAIPARPEHSAIPKSILDVVPTAPGSNERPGTSLMEGELGEVPGLPSGGNRNNPLYLPLGIGHNPVEQIGGR